MPLHHVVMFKIAGGSDGATAFDPHLQTLLATAPGVLSASVESDLDLRPGNARSFQRLMHTTFADEASWRAYLDSAPHQEFLAAVKDLIEGLGGIQYMAE